METNSTLGPSLFGDAKVANASTRKKYVTGTWGGNSPWNAYNCHDGSDEKFEVCSYTCGQQTGISMTEGYKGERLVTKIRAPRPGFEFVR